MMATGPTGGDLLAQTLRRAGVTQVFALHGGHLEALLKGCVENDIAMLDFRHEAAAGHAADAYARATAGISRRIGVEFGLASGAAKQVRVPQVRGAVLRRRRDRHATHRIARRGIGLRVA